MDIAQHLSATLKTLRQQRGWSLSRLAEETGVSKAMLLGIKCRRFTGLIGNDKGGKRHVKPGGDFP